MFLELYSDSSIVLVFNVSDSFTTFAEPSGHHCLIVTVFFKVDLGRNKV